MNIPGMLWLAMLAAIAPAQTNPALTGNGIITTIAGTDWAFPGDGKPAIGAPLGGLSSVAYDRQGNFYIGDDANAMVFKVGADGILDVLAGTGIPLDSGDEGPAALASLSHVYAIAVDSVGSVIIYGSSMRKVTPDGIIHTLRD